MTLNSWLRKRGGIARTRTLADAGYSPYLIQRALRAGSLRRPRRGWVALPDADPQLLFAAEHGVLLTCVTQAQRLGLWVMRDRRTHVAAPHPGSHVEFREGVTHWGRPLVHRAPDQLVDPVENVLATVSICQPRESALTILDSALNSGLVTIAGLETLPLSRKMRDLLESSSPYSDSGLETLFRTRLRWLRVPIRAQTWVLGHRVDFLIGSRLIVQIDGGQHVGPQRTADNLHDARLRLEGYHVIRVSYEQVMHRWEEVQDLILSAIARGLHLKH